MQTKAEKSAYKAGASDERAAVRGFIAFEQADYAAQAKAAGAKQDYATAQCCMWASDALCELLEKLDKRVRLAGKRKGGIGRK
jgi:hypothetical protein